MKYIYLLVTLLFVTACNKTLSQNDLANVLTDMYLYEDGFGAGVNTDSLSIYRSVFLKHGCSEEEFKRSIYKYGADPKLLKEVYIIVEQQLKERKEGYDAIIFTQFKIAQEEQHLDSLYRFPADTSDRHFLQRCALQLPDTLSPVTRHPLL